MNFPALYRVRISRRCCRAACLCLTALSLMPDAFGANLVSDQWARGQTAFQAHCTSGCHMEDLRAGSIAPALSGSTFLQHWQGLGANELYERMRNTMPQQKPRSLSDQTYVDILAFLLHMNGVPSGGTELQGDTDALSNIVIKMAN